MSTPVGKDKRLPSEAFDPVAPFVDPFTVPPASADRFTPRRHAPIPPGKARPPQPPSPTKTNYSVSSSPVYSTPPPLMPGYMPPSTYKPAYTHGAEPVPPLWPKWGGHMRSHSVDTNWVPPSNEVDRQRQQLENARQEAWKQHTLSKSKSNRSLVSAGSRRTSMEAGVRSNEGGSGTPRSIKSMIDGLVNSMSDAFVSPSPKRPDISTPYDPRHLTHVGFNATTGQFFGLPKEWQILLQQSGITLQEQERNPQTVMDIGLLPRHGTGPATRRRERYCLVQVRCEYG